MIIDAKDLVLGRLCSYAAKQALLGEKIDIVNCEKAIITGSRSFITSKLRQRLERGQPHKGPIHFKKPERYVKRAIRGMLPYKKERGLKALNNIKCYNRIPEFFKDKNLSTLEFANVSKMKNLKYLTVKDACEFMGGK